MRSNDYYKKLLDKATAEKAVVVSVYNEILSYVSSYAIADTRNLSGNSIKRIVNSNIQSATSSFKNFVMYALFGVETNWAKADVMLSEIRKNYPKGDISKVVDDIKKKFDIQTDEVFQFIRNSNYKQEIGRAIFDWGELGVGCCKLVETNNDKDPFYYQYIPTNEFLFIENHKAKPEIVLRYIYNKSVDELEKMFPEANFSTLKTDDKEFDDVTVLEIVTPFDDKYEWVLLTSDLEEVLDRKIMNYNPFTVFRFNLINNSCWGIGIGVLALDSYQRIIYYENLRARQALRIVDPPIMVEGDNRLTESFDLQPNGVNYGGDGISTRATAYPINTTGNLLPLEVDIDRFKQIIQELHFSEPFGSAENNTTRAVNEIQYRMQLLQQKFSDAVNNLFAEVLIPSFAKPRIVLLNRDLITKVDEERYFKPKFVNTLTKTIDAQEVENMVALTNISRGLFPQEAPFIYNTEKALNFITDKLGVDKELLSTNEERNASKQLALATTMQSQTMLQGE